MLLISVWYYQNRLGAVMTVCSPRGCNDSVLASTVVDHGKDHRSGNTKDYKQIVVYRVPAKHATWRGQNNISGWSDMSVCELLFQELALIKSNSTCWCSIKLGSYQQIATCFCHHIVEFTHLALINNHLPIPSYYQVIRFIYKDIIYYQSS